jgi:signal transduction histidine kinase
MAANEGDVTSRAQPRKTGRRAATAARVALAESARLETRDSGQRLPVAQPVLLTSAREQLPTGIARAPRPRRRATPQSAAVDAAADTPSSTATAGTAATPSTASAAEPPTPSKRRTTGGQRRARENTVAGLAERVRTQADPRPALPLPDPFFVALPELRQALLNKPLDVALRLVAEGVAGTLAPAAVQFWIADPASWASEQIRAGGLELIPSLRPRAMGRAATRAYREPAAEAPPDGDVLCPLPRLPLRPDPLIEEVLATRRPVVVLDPGEHPLASEWVHLVPATADAPAPRIGTLAAFPLHARGQFLGILAVGTGERLAPRHLTSLEELADLAALATDRDRLLSYSRSQEALAQTVVRHAPVAIAVLSGPDHMFSLANPAFSLLLGLDSETPLTGMRLFDAVHDRAPGLSASLRLDAVYEGGEPQAMIELPIHQLDRGVTYWNVASSPLPGVATSVGGVLVAAVEVTRQVVARQRAQDAAEMAQERIGQMMTLHATSLAVASQLGADASELLADILRRSIALLDARAGTVYVRNPRRGDLEVVVCQGLRGDYTGSRIRVGEGLAGRVALTGHGLYVDDYRAYPFQAAIYDGEDFSAVIAVPLIHHGQVVGVLDVLDDAQRRSFTDDDLWLLDLFAAQAAQAIENARTYVQLETAFRKQRELDRMKDDFIATASHELRTPLTGVQGFLDLLLDYHGSRDEPLAVDFLQKASESAQELAEIAERLLQTSRLDTGRMELHLGPVRLRTAVEATLRSIRELQRAQGNTHKLNTELGADVYVHADLGRLKEVLDNVVGNAIKYSPRGGRVTVRCAPAAFLGVPSGPLQPALGAIEERPTIVLPQLTADDDDPDYDPSLPAPALLAAAAHVPYVVVSVSDTGMGIPAEERRRLFGRFSRLDSTHDSQIRGTGLGLYICRQILRAMGGDIWLQESTPNRGSTFAFALPVTAPMPPARETARALAPAATPRPAARDA